MRARKLHWSHKTLGLGLASLLMLQGATGAALAFRDPLLVALNHPFLASPRRVMTPAVDRVLEAVDRKFGTPVVERVVFPRGARTAAMIYLPAGHGSQRRVIVADPETGAVVGEITGVGLLPFVLFSLHDELMVGDLGHVIGLVEGAGLLFLCISGVMLGRPWQAAAWRVRWKAGRLQCRFDLHRVTGLVLAVLLMFSAATGVILQAEVLLAPGEPVQAAAASGKPNWSYLMPYVRDLSRSYGPEAIEDIRMSPQLNRATIAFYAKDTYRPLALDRVTIDLTTGGATNRQHARDEGVGANFLAWIYPLHSGRAFGAASAALAVIGLGLFVLPMLGVLLWFARSPGRRATTGRCRPQSIETSR